MTLWHMLYWAGMGILVADLLRNNPKARFEPREFFVEQHLVTGYVGTGNPAHFDALFDIYETYKAKAMH